MDREDRINRLLATEGTDVLGNNEEINKRLSRNGRVQEIPLEKLRCVDRKLKKITCPNCGAAFVDF